MGNPYFGCVVPLPHIYITPLPFVIAPFIILPTWVHISPLGLDRVGLPFPLPTPWIEIETMPQRLMQVKIKSKSIIGHIQ